MRILRPGRLASFSAEAKGRVMSFCHGLTSRPRETADFARATRGGLDCLRSASWRGVVVKVFHVLGMGLDAQGVMQGSCVSFRSPCLGGIHSLACVQSQLGVRPSARAFWERGTCVCTKWCIVQCYAQAPKRFQPDRKVHTDTGA